MSIDKIREGIDFYFNDKGLMVFTKEYHLKRGYCCKSGCLNCPYGFIKENKNFKLEKKNETKLKKY
ncbi:DUF5522 domain-containing protein [Silvanigrella sp.]|jgi:hypothetical protein|uniref:DUF5522 domain-containing protein n=1 Tax=Silvanigrella sp. TaxID=2024976 RepID=UPI0037C5F98A